MIHDEFDRKGVYVLLDGWDFVRSGSERDVALELGTSHGELRADLEIGDAFSGLVVETDPVNLCSSRSYFLFRDEMRSLV